MARPCFLSRWRDCSGAFFDEYDVEKYTKLLTLLMEMKRHVSNKNIMNSKAMLVSFIGSSKNLLKDFGKFRMNKMAESETFLYWDSFIEMVRVAKNLVRADQ